MNIAQNLVLKYLLVQDFHSYINHQSGLPIDFLLLITHLHFSEGKSAHIYVSWLHPYKEQKLVVIGDKGMAVFDDGKDWDNKLSFYAHKVQWRDDLPIPEPAESESIVIEKSEPLKLEAEHFVESVSKRQVPRTDGKEGKMVLSVLDAAERSMELNTTVDIC